MSTNSSGARYVFVTGGVVSSIGKGITTACLGRLLKNRGFKVSIQKIDPYINVDAGTMNPHQHGEVFVTEDGAETDLDLGHYERFVDINLNRNSNVTTGTVYGAVISKERRGNYLGQTVQVIPHVTDEIKQRIRAHADEQNADVAIVEIGGTVGDIESLPFLEAIRQMKIDEGTGNTMYIHVTLIPYVGPRREMKTKPTQHSVRELRNIGIQPDILICRTKLPMTDEMRRKVALFCDTPTDAIIEGLDTETLYELPLTFEKQNLAHLVLRRLGIDNCSPDLSEWEKLVCAMKNPTSSCSIGMVGKYMELHDAYISIAESLKHGGIENLADVNIEWIDSETISSDTVEERLGHLDGILIPGGFGHRGIEGKVEAIQFAREKRVPFLGLCLGLQCSVIEFSRHVCGLSQANSSEFDERTPDAVIDILDEQKGIEDKGGTMRLGAYPCKLSSGSLAARMYGVELVYERHRHRYEVNPKYHDLLRSHGMVLSGLSPDERLVEIIELPDHPFYMATQFHPEFKSRPNRAHPFFREFVKAAISPH